MPDYSASTREELGAKIAKLQTEVGRVQIEAREVSRLLELGDQRLLASDGPCGGQNAATALSADESAELYQACQRILTEPNQNQRISDGT